MATQRDALAALSNLARFGDGRLHIFRSGGIAELIRKLSSPEESVRRYAVTTLHNLLLYLENSKEEIIALGGLKAFLPLLLEQNAKLQAMTADCVYLVLLDRPDCKQAFFAANGPSYLVNVLKTHSGAGGYFKLVYAIARCVRSVSVEQNNKVALVSMSKSKTQQNFRNAKNIASAFRCHRNATLEHVAKRRAEAQTRISKCDSQSIGCGNKSRYARAVNVCAYHN